MVNTKDSSFWTNHLLRRAGFGTTPDELKHYVQLGYNKALNELLNPKQIDNSQLETNIQKQNFDYTNLDELKRWWIYRMAFTKCPLEEKMTLFWHGHFATSDRKVKNPYAMYGQNQLFRKYAFGRFDDLLMAISKDPAMIIWLDNQQNRQSSPNENYAREIMELFTLGIGNYTEKDVKEAARAFTGWTTLPDGFFLRSNQHDYGYKTFLGVTGNLNGTDIIKILASQRVTGHFLANKLVKFFVADDPDSGMVNRIAQVYIDSNHSIKAMLHALFSDPVFLSEKAYHAKIKSPAELVIGSVKLLQVKTLDHNLPKIMASMGQDLFAPPNVKGWDGGKAWIATDTMMERFNFASLITSNKFNRLEQYTSASDLMYKQGLRNARQVVNYFAELLVDGDMPQSTYTTLTNYMSSNSTGTKTTKIMDNQTLDAKLRGVVHLIMTLPTYQLC
jgi:uncharacterized protein (DUF1800 family)